MKTLLRLLAIPLFGIIGYYFVKNQLDIDLIAESGAIEYMKTKEVTELTELYTNLISILKQSDELCDTKEGQEILNRMKNDSTIYLGHRSHIIQSMKELKLDSTSMKVHVNATELINKYEQLLKNKCSNN